VKHTVSSRTAFAFSFLSALISVNCGGGGGDRSTPPPPPPPALTITTTSLPDGVATKAYTLTLQASGGSGTKSWSVASGSLPQGLSLDAASGTISGTPAATGSSSVAFKVQDSSGSTTSPALDLFVNPVLQIMDLPNANANRGVFFQTLVKTNTLHSAIHWALGSSVIVPGLGLAFDLQDGNALDLNGVPRQLGNFSFILQAQDSSVPQQTVSRVLAVSVAPGPLTIHLATLPRAVVNLQYSYTFVATGGVPPYHWSGSGANSLMISADGTMLGSPSGPAPNGAPFTAMVTDSAGTSTSAVGSLVIVPGFTGRNDSIATATPITANGSYAASISPYSDPSSPAGPDSDYFVLQATPGRIITITAGNNRKRSNVTIDPVLEIVKDATGARFTTCQNPEDDNAPSPIIADATPTAFDDECLNDDASPDTVDSKLMFQVPNTGGAATTFYVHVLDFRGDARPDMTYTLTISGLQ
jgi:hypothetical protein